MKHKRALKKILSMMLAVAMVVTLIPQSVFAAYDVSSSKKWGDWEYAVLTDKDTGEKSVRIKSYSGSEEVVTVPATIKDDGEDLPVSETYNSGYNVFPNSVTKVIFSDGIKKIGDRTLSGCSKLTEVVLPASVEEISKEAFMNTSLKSVVLPANLTSIGSMALSIKTLEEVDFSECTKLTSIEGYVFSNCRALTSVNLTKCVKLKKIGDYAFSDCYALEEVTLPNNSIEELGQSVFRGSKIISIDLSPITKLTKIPDNTFYGCSSLESVTLPSGITEIGTRAFSQTAITQINLNGITKIGNSAFEDSKLSALTIPSTLTEIGERAFYGTLLEELTIPSNLISVGKAAFSQCKKMVSVDLTESVITSISNELFYQNDLLSQVDLPSGLTTIGEYAFACTSISEIDFPQGLTTINKAAFYSTKLTSISLPDSVTTLGKEAFQQCSAIETVKWPKNSGFKVIPESLFEYCPKLSDSVVKSIPESVEKIDFRAFRFCDKLKNIDLSNAKALTVIGQDAFAYNNIESVKFPNTALAISKNAFMNCSELTTITWPNNEGFTEVNGFAGCTSLDNDVIKNLPSTVTIIGESAFADSNYTVIELAPSIVTVGKNAFTGCNKVTAIITDENLRTIEERAFYDLYNVTSLYIAPGLRTIGKEAFAGCTGLSGKKIELPKSVRNLNENSFSDIGSENSHLQIYIYNQNVKIAETTDKKIHVDGKFYVNPFKYSYVDLFAFQYDDNGDDTFIGKFCDALAKLAEEDSSIHMTITTLDKTEYSHKVYGTVPANANVYLKKDGDEYTQIPNNNGKFEVQVNEGKNVYIKVSMDGYYDKYFMKLDTQYEADWNVCSLSVNDFEKAPASSLMTINLERIDGKVFSISKDLLEYKLKWNGQVLENEKDYRINYLELYILNEEIGDDDELVLEVIPDSTQPYAVSEAKSSKSNGTFDVKLIPWGTINVSLTSEFAGYNHILIFDENGDLYVYENDIFEETNFSDIKAGNYTVVAYNANSSFTIVNTLEALSNIGMRENIDYAKKEVTVTDNKCTNVSLVVPLLKVEEFARYINSDNSSVFLETTETFIGQDFNVRVNYELLSEAKGKIRVYIPNDATVAYVYNGNNEVNYTSGSGYCDVDITEKTGTIYVKLNVSEVGSHMINASYVIGDVAVPIGSVSFETNAIMIKTTSDTISSQHEYVNVYTTPYTEVSLYLGDSEEPLKATTNAVGRTRFDFDGPKGLTINQEYTIKAVTEKGSKEYTYTYYPKYTSIKNMGFIYCDKKYQVIKDDVDQSPNYVYAQKCHKTAYDVNGGIYWTFYMSVESEYELDDAAILIKMMDGESSLLVNLTLNGMTETDDGKYQYEYCATQLIEKVDGTSKVPSSFDIIYTYKESLEDYLVAESSTVQAQVDSIRSDSEKLSEAIDNYPIDEEEINEANELISIIYDKYTENNETDIKKEDLLIDKNNFDQTDVGELFFDKAYMISDVDEYEDLDDEGKQVILEYEESIRQAAVSISEFMGIPKPLDEYSSWSEVFSDIGYGENSGKKLSDYTKEELDEMGYTLSDDGTYAYKIDKFDKLINTVETKSYGGEIETSLAKDFFSTSGRVISEYGTLDFEDMSSDPSVSDSIAEWLGDISGILAECNEENHEFLQWLINHPEAESIIKKVLGVQGRFQAAAKFGNVFSGVGDAVTIYGVLSSLFTLYDLVEDMNDINAQIELLQQLRKKYSSLITEGDNSCFNGNKYNKDVCIERLDDEINALVKMRTAFMQHYYYIVMDVRTTVVSTIFDKLLGANPYFAAASASMQYIQGIVSENGKGKATKDFNRANHDYKYHHALRLSACSVSTSKKRNIFVEDTIDCNPPIEGVVTTKRINPYMRIFRSLLGEEDDGCFLTGTANGALDPSGIVYEAVESNTLEGVTATIYYSANEDGSNAEVWDAEEWDQINPQITTQAGFYQWDVPTGYWQVVFEKEGYNTAKTEWLPVPPPQMNLTTALVSTSAPKVETVKAYKDYVEISFDQYMDTKANLTVTGYTYEWMDIDSGYSKVLRLKYSGGNKATGTKVDFVLKGAKNYAGTALGNYTSSNLTVESRIADIKTNFESIVSFEVGKDTSFSVRAVDEDGNFVKDVQITATIANEVFATVGEAEKTGEDGRTYMPINTLAPGMTTITFTVPGTALTKTYSLFISDGNNAPIRPTATVGTKTLDESAPKENYVTVSYGDKLTLSCATEGVKIYYTTNNTCPCQDTPDRYEYTEPITLTENAYYRIAAYKDGMEYSQRLNITVTVHSHTYDQATFKWAANGKSATATLTCSCGDSTTKKATISSAVYKNATYTKVGTTRYTAKVVVDGKTYTSTKNVNDIAKKKLGTPKITSIVNSSKGVTIKYGKVAGATGYNIYRKVGAGKWTKIKYTTALSFTDTKATTAKATYQYRVYAYVKDANGSAQSAGSVAKSIVRVGTTTIKTVSNASKAVTIKWNRVSGATGYYLYRSVKGGSFKLYKTIKGETKVSYNDTGATANGAKYAYKIVPYRTVGGKTYKGATSAAKYTYRITPVNVTKVANVASKTVAVTWKRNAAVTGYLVSYTVGKQTKSVKVANTKTANITKKLTGIAKGSTVKVSIKAYKTVGKVNYWSVAGAAKSIKTTK